MLLKDLISGLPLNPGAGGSGAAVRVCDITEDSRTALPGSLFVARRGHKSDGRTFAEAAVKAGAVAVLTDDAALHVGGAVRLVSGDVPLAAALLAERFFGNPSARLGLVGVTGTNGKTTTTYFLHQLLNGAGVRCGLIGTICIDDGCEVAEAALTTPPALELSRTMARMLEFGCAAAAMECSSHALHQRRTAGLAFRVGVFTNLTHDHLDYHGTMHDYAAAKAMLFESLPASGAAVVNADDAWTSRIVRDCRAPVVRCRVVTAALQTGGADRADCTAVIGSVGTASMAVAFSGPWGEFGVELPLIGPHNAMNALQAAAAAHALGLSVAAIEKGLAHVAAPPGRLEPVTPHGCPLTVYVDYAHTDDALRRVLTVARDALVAAAKHAGRGTTGRLLVVFGCGGDRDATKRPKMGAVAAELADRVVVTSDNPRTERPSAIIDAVLSGIPAERRERVAVHLDRKAAIDAAVAEMQEGDVLIIAGKGHEDYQIMPDPSAAGGAVKRHFDDHAAARAALGARGIAAQPRAGRFLPRPLPMVSAGGRAGRWGVGGDPAAPLGEPR
jgi:UDP-N-acetylmuramoyl-L-alanyl-D-glutamate--2,6-diaminopimelate ligase